MGRKRTCELPFCKGVVEGTRNKRRCDKDRNIHLHQIISKNVKKIMRYIEGRDDLTANDVNRDLFKGKLDKNEKGSMYRLFQAMVRENYLVEKGKRKGLKVYSFSGSDEAESKKPEKPAAKSRKAAVKPPKPSPEEILLAKIREFVYQRSGQWNHEEWLGLINRPDIKEFGISEGDIGRILEEEKTRYWIQRNNY
ncbi:MAG: hypothetical protein ACQETH_02730 [Candidatus Rifleibacteriota bacterium]